MCFYNAQRFAQSKGFYVLGFIIIHSIPVEHAWVSDGIHYFDSTPVKSDAYYQVSIISVKNLNHLVSKLGDGYVDLYGVNKCGTSGIKIP